MAVIDVADPDHDREAEFWEGAVGRTLTQNQRHPEYRGALVAGDRFALLLQRLGEGPSRVHLDIHTDDLEAEVARLERLGAERVREVNEWCIMRDPAGLLFCVVPRQPGTLNDDNAQRWD
jgi:Glyoxalase-like domain